MTFGPDMGNGAKISAFISALEMGSSQKEAFQQVFGDQKQFYDKLSRYVSQYSFNAGLLPSVQVADAKSFPAKVLTAAERDYDLGSVDIGAHMFVEGKARMEAAVAADPKLAGPHEELGFLAWRAGQDEEAKAEWRKAVEADPKSYRAAFALLMSGRPLKDQSPQELEQTKLALDGLHEKAPRFAPVLVERALLEWKQGKLNPAFKDAMATEKLEPWRAEYRLLTARILSEGHQPKLAAKYARMVADRWPGSDHDEAVEVWSGLPAEARDDGPPLKLSFPEDATVIRGTILSTTCDKGLSVVLQPAGEGTEPVKVSSAGPFESGFADTLWVGEDHYTPCHHLEGLPAVVAYKAASDGTKRLLVLEIRDNLPTAVAVATPTAAAKDESAHP
jgi:Tfp pilus assembly protein PilF